MTSPIIHYQKLIESFVEGRQSATQFETDYLHLFKHDRSRSKEVYPILSNLFWAVEDFCPYPDLRENGDLDENQLLDAAKVALQALRNLENQPVTSLATPIAESPTPTSRKPKMRIPQTKFIPTLGHGT